MGKLTRTIAIDFDGCLCEDAWPDIGEPYWEVIHAAIREQVDGASLILWTCRTGHLLSEAIEACEGWGLTFDAVNANLPERLEYYGTESRKISADEYWDDRAMHMPESLNAPLTLDELREMELFEWLWVEVVKPTERQAFRKLESAYYQVFEDYTGGEALCCGWPGLIHEFEYADYGKTWLACRCKPELAKEV